MKADLNISFDEAFNGCKKQFSVRVPGKQRAESLALKIPKGCKEGTKLRLKGQGKPDPFGGSGDLICVIHIDKHPYFEMDGKDVVVNVSVTFSEAALGEKVEIPTPDGKRLRIRVPKGTQNGSKLTIKGKGVVKQNGEHGNLIAKINVVVPEKLSRTQEKKLKEYAKVENKEVRSW